MFRQSLCAVTALVLGIGALASCESGEAEPREGSSLESAESRPIHELLAPPGPGADSSGTRGKKGPLVAFDEPPKVLKRVEPSVPDSLLEGSAKTEVLVSVLVDTAGRPTNPEGVRGDARLFPYACEAASQWRFKPAVCRGIPIPLEIVLKFEIERSLPN